MDWLAVFFVELLRAAVVLPSAVPDAAAGIPVMHGDFAEYDGKRGNFCLRTGFMFRKRSYFRLRSGGGKFFESVGQPWRSVAAGSEICRLPELAEWLTRFDV